MKKLIYLLFIALFAISCTTDDSVEDTPTYDRTDTKEYIIAHSSAPQLTVVNSGTITRTGKVIERYTYTMVLSNKLFYRIRIDTSINFFEVSEEIYSKVQIGNTIIYQEYPFNIYLIKP